MVSRTKALVSDRNVPSPPRPWPAVGKLASAVGKLASAVGFVLFAAAGCATGAGGQPATDPSPRASQARSAEAVAFAIVRADSALIPLARLEGNRFTFPRRADGSAAIVSVTSPLFRPEANDATPTRWYHRAHPDREISITAGTPRSVEDHCESALAFTTNLSGQKKGPYSHHRLLGIAADAAGVMRSAVPVFETAPIWEETFAALTAAVDSGDAVWRRSPRNMLRLNTSDSITFKASVTLLSDGRAPLYMVIAKRDYLERKPGMPFDCPTTAQYTAYARPNGSGQLRLFGGSYEVDACDRKGMGDIEIVASATIGDRTIVFLNKHFYEWENYDIFEVVGNEVREVGRVAAGGC
jgi:hypothetical protein